MKTAAPVSALAFLALLWNSATVSGAETSEGTRTYRLVNPLTDRRMAWPPTVVSYPVAFEPREAATLWLTGEGGAAVPFQITNRRMEAEHLRAGTLNFVADLPVGATREFVLHWSGKALDAPAASPAVPATGVRAGDGSILLSNGHTEVTVPAEGVRRGPAPDCGPILQVGRAGKRYGTSAWRVAAAVAQWEVRRGEWGDLIKEAVIRYAFADGSSYTVTVRASAGMPFLDMIADGVGLRADVGQYWELDLTDMAPGEKYNRQPTADKVDASNAPWIPVDANVHPLTGEWRFHLAPFYPKDNAFRHQMIGLRNAEFVVGLSCRRIEEWISDRYPIWGSDRYTGAYFYTKDGRTTCRFRLANGRQWMAWCAVPAAEGEKPLLRNTVWHEILDLDKAKDWTLVWDEKTAERRAVFVTPADQPRARVGVGNMFYGNWMNIGFTQTGQEKNPSGSDRGLRTTIRGFDGQLGSLTGETLREKLAEAALTAYLHAGDSYFPGRHMLGGHPNFMGDARSHPGTLAAVLPNHPDAGLWADHAERTLQLLLRYHTRPPVKAWGAMGGRWTENPSCYMRHGIQTWGDAWAALRWRGDGRNIFAKPGAEELGRYMVDILAAPYQGKRLVVQQGAHSGDIRTPGEPYAILALALRDYAPLAAEHLAWAARIGETAPPGDLFAVIGAGKELARMGDGTPPLLETVKYTGYGLIMRRDVDTPNEVYVCAQQIDAGPNYRWGRAGEGGNGCLYFYAGGKRWTAHGGEDVGDASLTDTQAATSFGVWRPVSSGISRFKKPGQREPDRPDREGMFYGIGLRDLTEPLYPFAVAQYGRLPANAEYAGPDYRARCVLLVGADYLVIHDEVANPDAEGRFSWSTHAADGFPDIQQLRPGVAPVEREETGDRRGGSPYRRRAYTGSGDFLTLATHRQGVKGEARPWGVEVRHAGGRDLVFKALAPVSVREAGDVEFAGSAGVVRLHANGVKELAVFGAGTVRAGAVGLTTTGDAGASARFTKPGEGIGEAFAQAGGTLRVEAAGADEASARALYFDGEAVEPGRPLAVAPGRHIWQIASAGAVIPARPEILRTEGGKGDYAVLWTKCAGAKGYRVEELTPEGWKRVAEGLAGERAALRYEGNGKHILRVVATNGAAESGPSAPYPLYASDEPSRPPDGLTVDLYGTPPRIAWGEVLGAHAYRLERRRRGETAWKEIYRGLARSFADPDLPSRSDYDAAEGGQRPVWEYRVGAFNGNGGAFHPRARSSDPRSSLNHDPRPGERFRRQIETFETYAGAYDAWRELYNPILDPYPE